VNTSLYSLAAEYNEAAERLADLDLDEQTIADTLEGLAGTLEVKATNVAMFAKNLEVTAAAIKEAEGNMAKRRKAIEARSERLLAYLKQNMEATGITKIESPYLRIAIRNNPAAVHIDAESQIPAEFFKSKYADLASVVEAIREAFAANGLSYTQAIEPSEKDEVRVETILLHSSGEWLSAGVLALPVSKHDAQGFGSALTYARRYGLSAAVGVAPEDDDGNAATKAAPPKQVTPPQDVLVKAKQTLEACGSLAALQSTWESFPSDYKMALATVKESCKTRIKNADKVAA